jgi:hypothetical protein
MEETEEPLEEEDVVEEEDLDDMEPSPEDLASTPAPADAADSDVESLQEILVKQEATEEEDSDDEDEEVVPSSRDDRLEPMAVKVVPQQATEFTCRNCYLVKHRSQLKDKKRMLCRDCA